MTSKNNFCFVYITLPKTTLPITVGKFVVENLAEGAVGHFVYGKSYLARPDAVAIDPIELKLSDKIFTTAKMNGIFGSLRDASPDHWGRRVIEKELGRIDICEMEFLLKSPDDRIGALGFGLNQKPPAPLYEFNKTLDLEKLQTIAEKIFADDYDDTHGKEAMQIEELFLIGTSMGGARPKAVVCDGKDLWLAKFNTDKDRWNNALVEHAILNLATLCGLNVACSKTMHIGSKDVLLVKHFDREKVETGFLRHRMFSALTALQTDDSPTNRDKWSYLLLSQELRKFSCQPQKDAKKLFMRMIFNALITNNDDHPRNHAFISTNENNWKLSPAYDLTAAPIISQEHRDLAMIIGERGRWANAKNLISKCNHFLLDPQEAKSIIQTMSEIVKNNWYKTFPSASVSQTDCEKLRTAFVYDGFWTD
jgi:serine/threonine-protein kinase HipA